MLNVEYIDHLGSDLTVVNAARVSFNKHKEEFGDDDAKLIRYLSKHNHWAPFAHPQVTLRLTMPIFLARQMMKHQIGLTVSEVSRRYVDDAPEFYTPTEWRGRPTNGMKQGSSDEVIDVAFQGVFGPDCKVSTIYESAVKKCEAAYEDLLKSGIAPEQARMILPQSMMTSFYWTGSLYAFSRVYRQRIDTHAQKEAQDVAAMIGDIMEPLFPISWAALCDES